MLLHAMPAWTAVYARDNDSKCEENNNDEMLVFPFFFLSLSLSFISLEQRDIPNDDPPFLIDRVDFDKTIKKKKNLSLWSKCKFECLNYMYIISENKMLVSLRK